MVTDVRFSQPIFSEPDQPLPAQIRGVGPLDDYDWDGAAVWVDPVPTHGFVTMSVFPACESDAALWRGREPSLV